MNLSQNQFKNVQLTEVISESESQIIYKGQMKHNHKIVTVRVERGRYRSLYKQFLILDQLASIRGVPQPLNFGQTNKEKFYFITDFYEKPLSQIFAKSQLSLQSVLSIGMSLLRILEGIHKQNMIYGNLCPENIMFSKEGTDHDSQIHLIGFSEARSLYDAPKPKRMSPAFQYQSFAYHKTGLISKIDELESLGFLLVKLRTGQLPWENLQEMQMLKEKRDFIISKAPIPGMPKEFKHYFRQLRAFRDKPQYHTIHQLLSSMMSLNCNTHQHEIKELNFMTTILEVQSDVFQSQDYFFHSSPMKPIKNNIIYVEQPNSDSDTDSVDIKIKELDQKTPKKKFLVSD